MIHESTASATMPLKTQLHTCAFDLMTRRLGSLSGAGTSVIFFVATNTYLSHFLSLTFTGGSWHKCHFFCRDKHVFVSLSLSDFHWRELAQVSFFYVATNTYLSHFLSLTFTGGSWHKCHFFCRDKHVFVSLSLSDFHWRELAQVSFFCRDKHVFVSLSLSDFHWRELAQVSFFFVATNTYLSHFLSLTFTGGSWHKCHFFCRDKHVFVSLSLSDFHWRELAQVSFFLSRQTRICLTFSL